MVRVALAQTNLTVGDIDGNSACIEAAIRRAADEGAQVIVLPELAVSGYPPEDLVLKPSFVKANEAAVGTLAASTGDVLAIFGFVEREGDAIYNSAALCHRGQLVGVYRKQLLPNYGVFDEDRYFEPGREHLLLDTPSGTLGVCVCEDAWSPRGPVATQGDAGAQIIININASPFHKGKLTEREAMLAERARRARSSLVYLNMVGGQDELVFDGGSLVLDAAGRLIARLPQFDEAFAVVDVPLGAAKEGESDSVTRKHLDLSDVSDGVLEAPVTPPLHPEAEVYAALRLSLHDYIRKNGFEKAVIGLSGGIDSSLTATIAVDALGESNVLGVAMPSDFSTSHSVGDAKALAGQLGIDLLQIPIAGIYEGYLRSLEESFGPTKMGLAEENLQARIRGNLLMAISNRYGHIVIATGNKSEMACGYATLYGDMAGGFALLKDVLKTEVYALSRYRNELSPVIPENVLVKPPSAELRPDQKDSDSLPEYAELDPILDAYIEHDLSLSEIVQKGHDRAVVQRVIALVDRAEYKRRQAPPGPKVTTKAFGRDRRLPITNAFRGAPDSQLPDRVTGQQDGPN